MKVRVYPQNANTIRVVVAAHHTLAQSLSTCLEVVVLCSFDESHYFNRLCIHHTIRNGIHGSKGNLLFAWRQHRAGYTKQNNMRHCLGAVNCVHNTLKTDNAVLLSRKIHWKLFDQPTGQLTENKGKKRQSKQLTKQVTKKIQNNCKSNENPQKKKVIPPSNQVS